MKKSTKRFPTKANHPYNTRSKAKACASKDEGKILLFFLLSNECKCKWKSFSIANAELNNVHLHADCYEAIGDNLDLSGLCALADVCTQAQEAAEWVFRRKYKTSGFRLDIPSKIVQTDDDEVSLIFWDEENLVNIRNYKEFLKLLRNFGHNISKLIIDSYNTFTYRE